MRTAKPPSIKSILNNMVRSACPESPIDIHLQNQQIKMVLTRAIEKEPMTIYRAVKDLEDLL